MDPKRIELSTLSLQGRNASLGTCEPIFFKINDFVFVRVVGLEPTYREDQYELFVEAGRFYRPLPLHSHLFEPHAGLEPATFSLQVSGSTN